MARYVLVLLVFFITLQAYEGDDLSLREVELSSESEPIAVIAGCVNAVTGAFFQVETDLFGNTIDPIKIVRFYDSQSKCEASLGLGSSLQFPIFASDYQKGARHSYALIAEREGGFLTYQGDYSSHNSSRSFHVDSRLAKNGYTHGGGIKSGAIIFNRSAELNGSWVVTLEDGTIRKYGMKTKLSLDIKKRFRFPTQEIYFLKQEEKPNGNVVTYEYQFKDNIPYLSLITTYNKDKSAILNQVSISSLADGYAVSSSCGQQVIYKVRKHHGDETDRTLLSYVSTSQMGHTSYGYKKIKGSDRPVVSSVTKLHGFQQEVELDEKRRVTSLYHTVGTNNEKVLTHALNYGKDYTCVTDCLGKRLVYFFDDFDRVIRIEYKDKNNPRVIIRQDVFEWNEKGLLKSKSVQVNKDLYHKKSYEYDERGNTISETISGNITGTKNDTFLSKNELETDKYTIRYEYSKDGFNLLLKSSTPEGLIRSYEYVPGTSLKSKEIESYNGLIQKRIFRKFDMNGQISELIEDDGSGIDIDDMSNASFRRLTCFKAIDSPGASFGKCEIQENYFIKLPSYDRELLNKEVFEYDSRGNPIQSKVMDANGRLLSIAKKKFNEQNRLIEETDACGNIKSYLYDFNGNRTEEINLTTEKKIKFFYNSTNHLVRQEILYAGEEPRITVYAYDPLGNKIRETDEFGNDTLFNYDMFGNEITIVYPPTSSSSTAVIQKRYNILNQLTSKIDERGFETRVKYNIYGAPIKTNYPDGSFETNEYYLSGLLKKNRRADGSYTLFEYDPKGRLTKKETHEADGRIISSDLYEYKGDLLEVHQDLSGLVTNYTYDCAGRLIQVQIGDKTTQYIKDGLGRDISKIESDRVETYEYDAMDRVVSIKRGDESHEIYAYDSEGNKVLEAHELTSGQFIKRTSFFNGDNTVNSLIDEEGKKTEYTYDRNVKNNLNQKVLAIIKKEPSGRICIYEFDTRGRLALKQMVKSGVTLSRESYEYDLAGNLIKTEIPVLTEGNIIRTYSVERKYDSLNRLTMLVEGDKITRYEYDFLGRKSKFICPNGVELEYTYDALDRVLSKKSSDGIIDYECIYDSYGNLIESYDQKNKVRLRREFDFYGRLLKEEFLGKLYISYQYDQYDRVTQITLPDQKAINYTYDPYHLAKISYDDLILDDFQYDKMGRMTHSGLIDYGYDALSRIIKIISPTLNAIYGPYDLSGNLLKEVIKTPSADETHQFTYDDLNSLTNEGNASYTYDSLGNCLSQNGNFLIHNDINQLIHDSQNAYEYDANGQVLSDSNAIYVYDALGRLISYKTNEETYYFSYDSFNRCLSINDQKLLYFGEKEIASFCDDKLIAMRIVHPEESNERTYSVCVKGNVYNSVQDIRNNIVQLVDSSGTIVEQYEYSAFKETSKQIAPLCPWRYANRRQVNNLSLYTYRFYHHEMRRWITPDPLDFEDGYNLYCFVKNNPYRYQDKDGRFAFVIPLAMLTFDLGASITAVALPTLYTAMTVTAAAATYCGIKTIDQKYGTNIAGSLFQQGSYVLNSELAVEEPVKDKEIETVIENDGKYSIRGEKGRKVIEGVYSPDRPLPQDGKHQPDSDAPHTQLGTRNGRGCRYPQVREYGYNGELIKDIDFTDHGYPDIHPVPHQHEWLPNPTGGSKIRDKNAKALEGWHYAKKN